MDVSSIEAFYGQLRAEVHEPVVRGMEALADAQTVFADSHALMAAIDPSTDNPELGAAVASYAKALQEVELAIRSTLVAHGGVIRIGHKVTGRLLPTIEAPYGPRPDVAELQRVADFLSQERPEEGTLFEELDDPDRASIPGLIRGSGMVTDPDLQEFPTTLTWRVDDVDVNTIKVKVDGGSIDASVLQEADGEIVVCVETLEVDKGKRGEGRGTYLVKALAREAAARGATSFLSDIRSGIAMRNRFRIFGAEKLQIDYDDDAPNPGSEEYKQYLLDEAENSIATVNVDLTDPDVRRRLFS